jgi:hypothetical protein
MILQKLHENWWHHVDTSKGTLAAAAADGTSSVIVCSGTNPWCGKKTSLMPEICVFLNVDRGFHGGHPAYAKRLLTPTLTGPD